MNCGMLSFGGKMTGGRGGGGQEIHRDMFKWVWLIISMSKQYRRQ